MNSSYFHQISSAERTERIISHALHNIVFTSIFFDWNVIHVTTEFICGLRRTVAKTCTASMEFKWRKKFSLKRCHLIASILINYISVHLHEMCLIELFRAYISKSTMWMVTILVLVFFFCGCSSETACDV